MGTSLPAAPHTMLGSKRMAIALAILVAALAAVITTVLLLQSGSTVAPATVVDEGPAVGSSEGDWLKDYRFGSADSAERSIG